MRTAFTSATHSWRRTLVRGKWHVGVGYLALYLLLDWASYVEPLPHTSITAWNPNTGIVMALLLARGTQWTPLVALSIFVGEVLFDVGSPPWPVLALTSWYLAGVYAFAAWSLRRRNLQQPIETPSDAAWFAGVVGIASVVAAAGYVGTLLLAGQLQRYDVATSVAHYSIGEFSGIIALTPLLLQVRHRNGLWRQTRKVRPLVLPVLGILVALGFAFAVAAARDVRLFYPLFAPVTWISLRYGVQGAMLSVSIVQAALVAALELVPGSIPLFDVQFPLLALGITGLFLGALATQRDVALRRVRDQDAVLQRSLRFAAAGQLASALTHELNQPMTALLSYVRAAEALTELQPTTEPRLVNTLHRAGEEVLRAAAVLRRLREFYRGESARPEPTDPVSVCARVATVLQDRMRCAAVEFELRAAESLPRVMVDRTQLDIVLHNLLTNSLDALEALPSPEVRLRRIEVGAEAKGTDVLIAVDDSGPGIPASLVKRLFEPFVTSKTTGMGLGLALSRTLLRHQGGDLHCEPSRLGGVRFVIRLTTVSSSGDL